VNESFFKSASFLALGAGIMCGLGAVTFFKALPLAPGSILMPLIGLYVLVAAIGCLIIFKETVSLRVISGIVLAVIAIMLLGK
jgi:transporter family protein